MNELNNENNREESESKTWNLVDAIFSAGIFRFFTTLRKAEQEENARKELLHGLMIGGIFVAIMLVIIYKNG